MTYKFKFWVGDIESEAFKYKSKDYNSYEDLIFQMEQDRTEWTFDQIDSGYTEIKTKKDDKDN